MSILCTVLLPLAAGVSLQASEIRDVEATTQAHHSAALRIEARMLEAADRLAALRREGARPSCGGGRTGAEF